MKLEIIENSAEKTVISLNGELDSNAAPQFATDMEPVMNEAGKEILLDFTDLEYISSAGMRTILLLNKTVNAKGGKVIIKGMSEDIRQIFHLTGFDALLEIL